MIVWERNNAEGGGGWLHLYIKTLQQFELKKNISCLKTYTASSGWKFKLSIFGKVTTEWRIWLADLIMCGLSHSIISRD